MNPLGQNQINFVTMPHTHTCNQIPMSQMNNQVSVDMINQRMKKQ